MPKTRVYFDPDVLPIVDNILDQTGLKSYTHVVNWMIKKYGHDFIQSYNHFLSEAYPPKHNTEISTSIELKSLEAFRGL